jgi:hypothetical protein
MAVYKSYREGICLMEKITKNQLNVNRPRKNGGHNRTLGVSKTNALVLLKSMQITDIQNYTILALS